jgi:hypothetical protein
MGGYRGGCGAEINATHNSRGKNSGRDSKKPLNIGSHRLNRERLQGLAQLTETGLSENVGASILGRNRFGPEGADGIANRVQSQPDRLCCE